VSSGPTGDLARAIQDVSEKTSLLIREEIELAKAEVGQKVTKLGKGVAVGVAAGVFAVFALIYLGHALAWLFWKLFFGQEDLWLGYLVVTGLLLLLGAIAGFLAFKFVKGGAPPTPQMAIDEGKRIKETIQGHGPRPEVDA
jgi:uncharacterized membrane protein YqjE